MEGYVGNNLSNAHISSWSQVRFISSINRLPCDGERDGLRRCRSLELERLPCRSSYILLAYAIDSGSVGER
jgi:hypothetical protein